MPDLQLLPASAFSLAELTHAYNQTRVDYMIPMQMDAAHLGEYLRIYDVALEHSFLVFSAPDGSTAPELYGLAMLGLRPGRCWVTRLGVTPASRRRGVAAALVSALLARARALGHNQAILEVIEGNTPAHSLFRKLGYRETRRLLVLRRPPAPPRSAPAGRAAWLEPPAALDLLGAPAWLAWTHERESFENAGDARGLRVELPDGAGRGWLVFRRHADAPGLLSHFTLHTEAGEPARVGAALLAHLFARFPTLASEAENLAADDPHLPALLAEGFGEAFRRIEMRQQLPATNQTP